MDEIENYENEMDQIEIANAKFDQSEQVGHLVDSMLTEGGASMSDIMQLESFIPGIAMESYPRGGFSTERSPLNYSIALEMAMDARKALLLGGAAGLIGIIFAIIKKFSGGGGGGEGSGGGSGGGSSSDSTAATTSYHSANNSLKEAKITVKAVREKLKGRKDLDSKTTEALAKCYACYSRLTGTEMGLENFEKKLKDHPDTLMPNEFKSSMFSPEFLKSISYTMFTHSNAKVVPRLVEYFKVFEAGGKKPEIMKEKTDIFTKVAGQFNSVANATAALVRPDTVTLEGCSTLFGWKPEYVASCSKLIDGEAVTVLDVGKCEGVLKDSKNFISSNFRRAENVTQHDDVFEAFWKELQTNSEKLDVIRVSAKALMEKATGSFEKKKEKEMNEVLFTLREYKNKFTKDAGGGVENVNLNFTVYESFLKFTLNELAHMLYAGATTATHFQNMTDRITKIKVHTEEYDKSLKALIARLDKATLSGDGK